MEQQPQRAKRDLEARLGAQSADASEQQGGVSDAKASIDGIDMLGGFELPPETRAGAFDLDKLKSSEITELVLVLTEDITPILGRDNDEIRAERVRADRARSVLRILENDLSNMMEHRAPGGIVRREKRGMVEYQNSEKADRVFFGLVGSGDSLAARLGTRALGIPILKAIQESGDREALQEMIISWAGGVQDKGLSESLRSGVADSLRDLLRVADWLDEVFRQYIESLLARLDSDKSYSQE